MQALNESLIDRDHSYGEGGGQMLETSLALSTVSRKPIPIHYYCEKRKGPGFRPRHLKGEKRPSGGENGQGRSLLFSVSNQRFYGAKGESRSEGFTGIPSG